MEPLRLRLAAAIVLCAGALAARGIAQFDRAEGVALLKRELANRDPERSTEALRALNELTDHHYSFDFYRPAERQQAIAAYVATREEAAAIHRIRESFKHRGRDDGQRIVARRQRSQL